MQEVSVDQELQNIFGASTRGDWKQMATLELKGKDPDEALR